MLFITHTLLSKKRKGMTAIIGTLLFIGILFTTLIPLQMSMLYTDAHETQLLQEIGIEGDEKSLESLSIVAYPTSQSSNKLKIRAKNNGNIDIKLAKLWIKNNSSVLNETIIVGQTKTLGPFNVSLDTNTSYPVKVITDRGNIVSSEAGNIIYTSEGIWFTPTLGINVYIANDKGKYYIKVSNSTWYNEYLTLGQDFGDLVVMFNVTTIGSYNVICKKNSESGPNLPGTPMDVDINWPNGPPIVFVYTSGLDT